jgi:hypothetical protein
MMNSGWSLGMVCLFALSAGAQDQQRSIQEVLKEHGPTIRSLEGVVDVGVGGSSEEPRIVVRVSSEEAKAAVSRKIGGNVEGYKFFIYVAAAPGQTVVSPAPVDPPQKPPPSKAEPEKETNPDSLEDCDIMRDHLKLKPVTRYKDKKTIDGCQLMRRSRVGGGGGHAFWYTRHRFDCPIRTNRVTKPGRSDEFTTWVFTRGFQPVQQGSFLVFELKGSDKLWFEGVKQDLTALLPYIREGARWVSAKEEDAGEGWRWEVSKKER